MRKLGIPEWLVEIVQSMYRNPQSKVRVNGSYSNSFSVKVGVHRGSVLSPLLFIILLEPFHGIFHGKYYADNLVIIVEYLKELCNKLTIWKHTLHTVDTNKLGRTDRAMLRLTCGIRPSEQVCTKALYHCLYIPSLDSLLRTKRLRWYGHACRNNSWLRDFTCLVVPRTPKEDLVSNCH